MRRDVSDKPILVSFSEWLSGKWSFQRWTVLLFGTAYVFLSINAVLDLA